MGAVALVVALATDAAADVLQRLPQNANSLELTYSPAYDYDGDGCYATAAIGSDGRLNPGLSLGGSVSSQCHGTTQLTNANTYSREKCNNGWCAVMYGSYFEKDQATPDPFPTGHTHDWEHVVVWINADQVKYVSVSQHSGYEVAARSSVRFDGNHPKIVYHKDGLLTHAFRFATANDEPPENATGAWFYPPIVGWAGYPAGLRDKLTAANFGDATLKITNARFAAELAESMPSGIPFNPNA